jgi:recombination protein RecA
MYNSGISRSGDVLDLGVENQLVERSGTWFSYKNTRLGQGRENAKQFIAQNPDLLKEIEQGIISKIKAKKAEADTVQKKIKTSDEN